jgi:protein-S-isoprenylcysteine O-methyltransferase Ste14
VKRKALLTETGNNHILHLMSKNAVPEAAHESWWQISEVVFGVPLLPAILLQWIAPLRVTRDFFLPFIIAGGIAFFLLGVFLVVAARREFARLEQYTDPGHPTTILIMTGVFSFSRNPLYLGVVFLVMGIGLMINSWWVFIFLLPSLVACRTILIAPEERYLGAKFGNEYRTYAARVRRWFGRRRH